MAKQTAPKHVDACRTAFYELRQVEVHESRSAMALPINLKLFLREFESYIEWAERNDVSVTEALRRPLTMTAAS